MLILSRRKNQSIILNGNIELIIIDSGNEQVKIGIKAPKEVSIYRKELYEQIKKEMHRASLKSIKEVGHFKEIPHSLPLPRSTALTAKKKAPPKPPKPQ